MLHMLGVIAQSAEMLAAQDVADAEPGFERYGDHKSLARYAGEFTKICVARAYRNFSSQRASAITIGFFNTPMLTPNSGHRSRTSSKNGLRRIHATNHAETA